MLGNDDPKASIPGEIIPHREFYDYAAKYLEEGTRLLIPAKLTQGAGQTIPGIRRARVPLPGMPRHGARGFFPGAPHRANLLNEVNTIPGFTSISMYPKLWEASGFPTAS